MNNEQYTIFDENSLRKIKSSQAQGKLKIVSRYLQDIPCKVNCTHNCNRDFDGLRISPDVFNYVIIDTEYLINFSEVLDLIDNIGFIITLSTMRYIQNYNRRLYYKLKKLFEDPAKSIILFQNEFHRECFITQKENEETLNYITRLNYFAAQFYLGHLDYHPTVVLLTANTDVAMLQYSNCVRKSGMDSSVNVEIMKIKQYLSNYHKDNFSTMELVDSLEAAFDCIKNSDVNIPQEMRIDAMQEYLSDEVLARSVNSGDFLKGIIRVNKFKSRDEAIVVLSEGNSTKQMMAVHSEVLIQGQLNRNRAIDGDCVALMILPESQWASKKLEISGSEASAELALPVAEIAENEAIESGSTRTPTGRVVGIIRRNWRDYVCSFEKSDLNVGQYVLVTPYDRRIPRIRIGITSADKLINHRFIVRIDGWPLSSKYPNGHFVESIGVIGDLETETRTLLIEYNLYNRPFTASQLAELPINTPDKPWKMNPDEVSKRRDLRELLIFSIDPIGCQDVDDTLSIRKLPNGNVELGVHIADVTHFVKPHSLLDLEARKRSTSIYMADRRFDMLPHVLSGDLCSLWSDVDRYAVSVVWELTSDIEVVSVEYFRSVIRSSYKLHYELAQDIYDSKIDFKSSLELIPELAKKHKAFKDGAERFQQLKSAITMLINVSSILKTRRIEAGGLELEGMEVQVKFSDPERTQLEDLHQKEPLEVHETIAECMIFANHWVAKKCLENYPTRSCLRHHPSPRMDHFVELIHCANTKGFTINFSSNLELAKSLDLAVDKDDLETNKILRSLATMAMSNAQYFSTGSLKAEDYYHYGLALPTYTHFTSPIRRYADILVHRILLCSIEGVPEESLLTNSSLADQCNIMNNQHRQAQLVQRASIELFQAMFFKNKETNDIARYTEGVIVKLRSNGFVVHIPRYGIKGSVFLKKQDNSIAWLKSRPKPLSNMKEVYHVEWLSENDIRLETECYQQLINKLTVIRGANQKKQIYKLFDRVFLRIDASESHSHGLSLQLEYVGQLRSSKQNVKQLAVVDLSDRLSKDDLFQNVREANDEKVKKRKYVEEEEIDESVLIGSLHSSSSMCNLFRQFKIRKLGISLL